MLVPLNRYFQTLVPALSSVVPDQPAPKSNSPSFKPFSLPNFLAHLRNHGPNPLQFRTKGLSTKSRVEGDFYASFCMSANFPGWLASKTQRMGLAVASQTALPIGTTFTPSSLRLGIMGSTATDGRRLSVGIPARLASMQEDDQSESGLSRFSSEDDSSAGNWRASEDDPGESSAHRPESYQGGYGDGSSGGAAQGSYFGRRASDGLVKGLHDISLNGGRGPERR
jgi:hypothetical protein